MIDSLSYLIISSLLVGFAACTGMAVLQYPLVRWLSRTRSTRLASDFWFAWGILPVLMGTFLGGFALAFAWVGSTGWLSNPHTQSSPQGGVFFWGPALACFAVVVTAAVRTYRRYLPAYQLAGGAFPERTGNGPSVPFSLLPSGFPVAFTAGLFFPRVYLTQAATELLTVQEQDIVLSHEQEHIRRRDPLRLLLLTFCEYWLPGVRYIRQ
jgi:Zn-dependent protease with chaperone function